MTTPRKAKPPKPSPRELLESQACCVNSVHEGIAALSLALEDIEGQDATFSTDLATEYVRAAILEKLGTYSKRQCDEIHKLFERIKALGPGKAA